MGVWLMRCYYRLNVQMNAVNHTINIAMAVRNGPFLY